MLFCGNAIIFVMKKNEKMKRTLAIFVLLLLYTFSAAQNEISMQVIPRLDLNGNYSTPENKFAFGLRESALYTQIEGDVTPYFSFEMFNTWASMDIKDLYKNILHSDTSSWLGTLSVTGKYKGFFLKLGKQPIKIANFENDLDDYNVFDEVHSKKLIEVNRFQLGGSFGWDSPDNRFSIMWQTASSPLGETYFSVKHLCHNIYTHYLFDRVHLRASLSYFQGDHTYMASLGSKFMYDAFSWSIDSYYYSDDKYGGVLSYETSINDKLSVVARLGLERLRGTFYIITGAQVFYYPLKNKNLRIHGLLAYNGEEIPYSSGSSRAYAHYGKICVNMGATYFFNFRLL